jgi:uncharacterized protein YecT (DUF1311 family)
MMSGGSRRIFMASALLLATGPGCASVPSPEAEKFKATIPAASGTPVHVFDGGHAGTLFPTSTVASILATTAEGVSAVKDCDALALADKESCYARYDEATLAECEAARLYSCAPYARMHRAEVRLKQAGEAMLHVMRTAYASYEHEQPGYLKDAEDAYASAESAWRAYRDAHCGLTPMLEGMSRQDFPGLIEMCRAIMTEAHVRELEALMSNLFAEGAANDERKSRAPDI